MRYNVYFNLFSTNEFRRSDETKPVSNLDEAVSKVDNIKLENDILCVFIEDINSKVQIYLEKDNYYFQLHMTNGMYEVYSNKKTIIYLLESLDEVCNRPTEFGLTAISV